MMKRSLLALLIILSLLLPTLAQAEGEAPPAPPSVQVPAPEGDVEPADGIPAPVSLEATQSANYFDPQDETLHEVQATPVTESDSEWNSGWYVANESISMTAPVIVTGSVNLILNDSIELTVPHGIRIESGASLTIWSEKDKLIATSSSTLSVDTTGNPGTAAIGGQGNLIIYGGEISAGDTDSEGGNGIEVQTLTVHEGHVHGQSGTNGSADILVHDLTVESGSVACDGGFHHNGIVVDGTLTVNGGQLNASCTADPGESLYAIQGGTIVLKGGSTQATVISGSEQSAAISVTGGFRLAGGRLQATNEYESGAAFDESCGIQPGYVNEGYPKLVYSVQQQNVWEEAPVPVLLTKGLDNGWGSWSDVELSPLAVTEITVKPESVTVSLDGSAAETVALSGEVTAYPMTDQGEPALYEDPSTFTIDTSALYADLWTLEGASSSDTKIATDGLTVGADERAAELTVALSLGGQSGTANIPVEQPNVTVTYSDGGLSGVEGLPTKEENVKRYSTLDKAQEPTPTRAGYTLDGWQTDSGDSFVFGVTEVTKDITLIPQWAQIAVSRVTLDSTEHTLDEQKSVTLTAKVLPEEALEQSVTWSFRVVTPAATSTSGIALTALNMPAGVEKILNVVEDPVAKTLTLTGVEAGVVEITAQAGGMTSAPCTVTVQHVWGDPTFTWTEGSDGTLSATAHRECLGGVTQTGEVAFEPTATVNATCEADGEITYEVTEVHFGEEVWKPTTPVTHRVTLPKLGHKWSQAPAWSWEAGLSKATATFTCQNDPAHQSPVEATVTATVKQPATCELAETTEYQAQATFEAQTYTDVRTKETAPKLGHDWSEPTWSWSGDFKTATAAFTCQNDPAHTESVRADITATVTPATCLQPETTEYQAQAELDGKTYTDTRTEETAPALGHKWSEPTWTWSGDLGTATAVFTCQNDPAHQSPVVATVTATVTQHATCLQPEITEYQAKVTFEAQTYTDVRTKETALALGHDWSEPTWTWSSDHQSATATFTCQNDPAHQNQVHATVTQNVLKAPSYTEDGLLEYKARLTGPDGLDYETTFQTSLPKLTAPQSTLRPSLRPEDELYLDGRPPIPAYPTLRPGSMPTPTPAPVPAPVQTAAPAGPLPTVPATGDATDLRGDVALLAFCAALLTALAVYLGKKRARR